MVVRLCSDFVGFRHRRPRSIKSEVPIPHRDSQQSSTRKTPVRIASSSVEERMSQLSNSATPTMAPTHFHGQVALNGPRPTITQPLNPENLTAFFIHSTEHPQGQIFFAVQPAATATAHRSSTAPEFEVRRPADPTKTQQSLAMLTPCTLYVQYPCKTKCRSLGICVHYQFVIGCRRCPDGLRCARCAVSDVQEVCVSRPNVICCCHC
jgi:hypothetical protein